LAPAFLAAGFNAEHAETTFRIGRVVILALSRKEKVWSRATFRKCAARISNAMFLQDLVKMVLQCETCPCLPPILDAQRKFDETVDVFAESPTDSIDDKMTFQRAKQYFLAIHPRH
jgi:hypothetical protein